jgi:hypothetical protein
MFNLQDEKDRMWLTMGLSESLSASIHISVLEDSNNWDDVSIVGAEKPTLEFALQAFNDYKTKDQLNLLRHHRNNLLKETDWWAVSDRTMSNEQIEYRQKLRDITQLYSSIEDVIWPEIPK